MLCVHWEFSLGAFLCTCAEHNNSSFLQGGIADSRRKKWASLEQNLEAIWLQNVVRRVFFFYCNSFPPPFALILLLDIFLAGGKWGSWDGGGGKEEEHICTSILLRNKGTDPSRNKDLAYLQASDSKSCFSLSYCFHLLLGCKKMIHSACVSSCLSCLEHCDTLWVWKLFAEI